MTVYEEPPIVDLDELLDELESRVDGLANRNTVDCSSDVNELATSGTERRIAAKIFAERLSMVLLRRARTIVPVASSLGRLPLGLLTS